MSKIAGKQIKDNTITKNNLAFKLSYTFVQSYLSDTWNVTHTLDKYTNVSIYDENNYLIEGEIKYIDNNRIQIIFNIPIKGTVIIF